MLIERRLVLVPRSRIVPRSPLAESVRATRVPLPTTAGLVPSCEIDSLDFRLASSYVNLAELRAELRAALRPCEARRKSTAAVKGEREIIPSDERSEVP